MKLFYSSNNNNGYGKGWYWREFKNWKSSQLFETEKKAIKAKEENQIIWNKY